MQDLAPSGGFPQTIRYQRHLPARGPSGALLLSAAFALMAYGWVQVGKGNSERRLLRNEKTWSRIHLVPLLQAETDRDLVRRLASDASTARSTAATDTSAATIEPDTTIETGGSSAGLKTPVKGLGSGGVYDLQQSEPVYYTSRFVAPTHLLIDKQNIIDAQWWRGSKILTRNPPYQDRADFKTN